MASSPSSALIGENNRGVSCWVGRISADLVRADLDDPHPKRLLRHSGGRRGGRHPRYEGPLGGGVVRLGDGDLNKWHAALPSVKTGYCGGLWAGNCHVAATGRSNSHDYLPQPPIPEGPTAGSKGRQPPPAAG